MKLAFYGIWKEDLPLIGKLEKEYGFEAKTTNENLTAENADFAKDCSGASVLGTCPVDEKIMKALSENKIRFLSTRSIGYNQIDLAAAKKYGITVCNSPYPSDSVAEFTVMLILMALRKAKRALMFQSVNNYALDGLKGNVLRLKTVGVIGGGRIGGRVVEILSGFGCKILYNSLYRDENIEKYAMYVDAETLYGESDIITFHLPLLPSTEKMVNGRTINKMKDGVILVNTARGELFDTETVAAGVESGKISALAMDVFEGEEGIYHVNREKDTLHNRQMAYLRQFPNVILTPHMAFYTQMSMDGIVISSVKGLVELNKNGTSELAVAGT